MNYTTLLLIILVTVINGLLGFAGVFSYFISKKTLQKILLFLVSFATGAILGGAFFHLFPESISNLGWIKSILLGIAGFVLFLIIEKILHWHHCHDGSDCKHSFSYLVIYGDSIHNFIDGILIASSFIISTPIGITTSILVLLHELPQEVGYFGVLVYGGFKKKKAILYSFLAQITSIIGGILGFFILSIKDQAIYLLPIGAGGFLYIAIIDLIPEIFKERKLSKLISNIFAIILGLLLLLSAKILAG